MGNPYDDFLDRKCSVKREQRGHLSDKVLFGHTKDEIMILASKHGVTVRKRWTNGDMATAIIDDLCLNGLDYETIEQIVTTPSSYI